ncbi:unnamed protein product [Urochloa humidicola]
MVETVTMPLPDEAAMLCTVQRGADGDGPDNPSDPMKDEAGLTSMAHQRLERQRQPQDDNATAGLNGDMTPPREHSMPRPLVGGPVPLEVVLPTVEEERSTQTGATDGRTPTLHTRPDGPLVDNGPQLCTAGPVAESSSNTVGLDSTHLEAVCFNDAPVTGLSHSPTHDGFVTYTRGSFEALPLHMPPDTSTPVKDAVFHFAQSVCRPTSPPVLQGTPPRRQSRAPPIQVTPAIRRSECLAKKSRQRATKPTIQAQNVLMKRLGISSPTGPLDVAAFQRFLEVFTATLSVSQCEALDTLLPESRPIFSAALVEVEP